MSGNVLDTGDNRKVPEIYTGVRERDDKYTHTRDLTVGILQKDSKQGMGQQVTFIWRSNDC